MHIFNGAEFLGRSPFSCTTADAPGFDFAFISAGFFAGDYFVIEWDLCVLGAVIIYTGSVGSCARWVAIGMKAIGTAQLDLGQNMSLYKVPAP